MKKSKGIFTILALVVVVLIAGQPAAQAGENLEFWPVNEEAVGKSFYGRIVLIMEENDPITPCEGGVEVTLSAYLTLYKDPIPAILSKTKAVSWNFMDVDSTVYCYPTDVDDPEGMPAALLRFLDEVVRPKLQRGNFDEIHLKEVTNEYESFSNNTGPTYIVVADVEIVAD